jgi:hypothetical protein
LAKVAHPVSVRRAPAAAVPPPILPRNDRLLIPRTAFIARPFTLNLRPRRRAGFVTEAK